MIHHAREHAQTPSWLVRWSLPLGLLLLLPALGPLLRPGFFVSDDGRFHVYRMAALARAWEQGVLHPRLFPEFGFGYGQAVLNFYSPLSYWPGALTALLTGDPVLGAKLTIGLGFLLAGLAIFLYVRALWGALPGLLAGVIYTYLPYHLADAYTRGAIPEHFAFLFPPWILWAYTRAFREERPRASWLWGALAWAGLVLTHNLTALLMMPVTLAYLLLLAVWTGRWRRLLAGAGSLLLAVGLSAGYWLPVLAESRAVGVGAAGPSQGYQDHLLTLGQLLARSLLYPYRDATGLALVYPLSGLTLALLVLGLLLFLGKGWLGRRWLAKNGRGRLLPNAPILGFHLALALLALAMTTTLSLPLWRPLTPLLGYLQYPWRFLGLVALAAAVTGAALPRLLPRIPGWAWLAGMTLAFLLVSLPGLPVQPLELPAQEAWSPERMWREDAEAGQVGATWTGEFLPVTVPEQRWALGRPRAGAEDGPPLQPRPQVTLTRVGYAAWSLELAREQPWVLRLHQFAQPGWNGLVDGLPAPVYPSGELGLVSVDAPAGTHQVELRFGATGARRLGAVLALLAALCWIGLAWRWSGSGSDRLLPGAALLLGLLTLALALNGLGLGRRYRTPRPIQAQLEDVALLVGAESRLARGGDVLEVTLYWLALRETARDYKAFVHLLGADGQVVAQHDGHPVGGFTPTSRWRPGELLVDTHRIPLPAGWTPQGQSLRAGLYELQEGTFRNLATRPPTPDNRVELGPALLPDRGGAP